MKKNITFFIFIFLLSTPTLFGQNWKLLTRQQKDSVIHSYYNKGNKYLALGLNFSDAFGSIKGLDFKVEPVFGLFVKTRKLLYFNAAYEQAKLQEKQLFRKHRQYSLGINYRYYLPERKTYSMFFLQSGFNVSYMVAVKNEGNSDVKGDFFDLIIPFEIGLSIPVNRFNFELSLQKDYHIFNDKMYYDFYAHKFIGQIRISYIIR